ncbi:hypothetical protein B0A53_01150 [Rhodotorula sp. CCFEE 5036]|nr:hypothetical protein B0A53_01150 [Rhodotorula sp. CCFEE 5036]
MAASIALKLSRGDETRVLSLPVHPVPAWQDFAASLAERFQLDDGPSAVTYLDHEGDQITVSSDVELKDMWHSFAGKSSVSVGVLAPFVEADRSAATEKLLESIRDAVAADPDRRTEDVTATTGVLQEDLEEVEEVDEEDEEAGMVTVMVMVEMDRRIPERDISPSSRRRRLRLSATSCTLAALLLLLPLDVTTRTARRRLLPSADVATRTGTAKRASKFD